MNIHNRYRTIYFARVRLTSNRSNCWLIYGLFQSGHSLHEHSYKIDADLSDIGWEYAAQLKDFVLDRRAKSLKDRGLDPKTSRLVVRLSAIILCKSRSSFLLRYGPPLAAVRTTPHGRSWLRPTPSSQAAPNVTSKSLRNRKCPRSIPVSGMGSL